MWYRIDSETGETREVTGEHVLEILRANYRHEDDLFESLKTFGTVIRTSFADYFWQRVPIPRSD